MNFPYLLKKKSVWNEPATYQSFTSTPNLNISIYLLFSQDKKGQVVSTDTFIKQVGADSMILILDGGTQII